MVKYLFVDKNMSKHMFCLLLCASLWSFDVLAINVDGSPGNFKNGQPQPNVGQQGMLKKQLKLAEQPDCAADVIKLCGKSSSSNNFAVLDCLQNERNEDIVSDACQHLIWTYKRNLTTDIRFDSAVEDVCKIPLERNVECRSLPEGKGFVIPCLIEYMDNITDDANCVAFLKRMKTIVFSDYHLIYKFADRCQSDIDKQHCGRIDNDDNPERPHNQGRTLQCLLEKFDDLQASCKKELLRVAELQADDYHSDRQLYYACREDREHLCPNVRAGDGRVYKCLYRHKFARDMSENCRAKLTQRQKLEQKDYKVNIHLARTCQKDIKNHGCQDQLDQASGFKHAEMSAILLCLEKAVKDQEGAALEHNCLIELHEVRRSLMEDYQINPVLVQSCSQDIPKFCGQKLQRNGKTIHCLMNAARRDPKEAGGLSSGCARALEDLMTEADVGDSYDIDPVLREECNNIVVSFCSHVTSGDGRILNCLLNNVERREMNEECRDGLKAVYYFISRDFRLDAHVYKYCRQDASDICSAPRDWHQKSDGQPGADPSPLILSCLFKHITHVDDNEAQKASRRPVSRQCAFEVRRVMHNRARMMELDPMVQQTCVEDLSNLCAQKTGKAQEIDCLEDKFDKIENADCKKAVKAYIEEVDEDPEIDELFARACAPFWEKHCKDIIDKANAEEEREEKEGNENSEDSAEEEQAMANNLMQCLIQQKHHPDMDDKCRAGVEHHQLITQKDYHFSSQFKQACQRDIIAYCPKVTPEKQKVVQCLSEHVRNDTLMDVKQRISKTCRKQLQFQLLQRSENIELDPELREACEEDARSLCPNISPGKAAKIECLRKHQKELQEKCHAVLFKREREEAKDPNIDFFLISKCKAMIKKYCVDEMSTPTAIFGCLQRNKDDERFDKICHKAIILREELRAKDYRLNPELAKHCSKDVELLCKAEMIKVSDDKETEGRVLLCLRKQYVLKKLFPSCEAHVKKLIKESAKDYKQDVPLAQDCAEEIETHCSAQKELSEGGNVDEGLVEQCLKEHVISNDITLKKNEKCYLQIARVLEENKFDINSDAPLYRACAVELKEHCNDIPSGDGRKIKCLRSIYDAKKADLAEECLKLLEQRVTLWEFVVKAKPVESVGELSQMIVDSPTKNYLLGFLLCFVGAFFLFGLVCGRVTKRIRRELKNR